MLSWSTTVTKPFTKSIYAFGYDCDLGMLDRITVFVCLKAQLRPVFIPSRSKPSKALDCVRVELTFSASTCSCATSYKKSVLPYGKCAGQRLLCVRRKRVLLQLCVVLAILNFNSAREGSFVFQKSKWIAHNVCRFREEKNLFSLFLWFKCPKRKFHVKIIEIKN